MTSQEVFDKVYVHLMRQKKRAYNTEEMVCVYLDRETGLKCAIGCLMREEDEPDKIEGQIYYIFKVRAAQFNYLLPTDMTFREGMDFLQLLQNIHDDIHPEDWEYELKRTASNFNLTVPNMSK